VKFWPLDNNNKKTSRTTTEDFFKTDLREKNLKLPDLDNRFQHVAKI
jgi:hypothetical protein